MYKRQGFAFDKNGGGPSFRLDLGSEAFGVRVANKPGAAASFAPLVNLMNHPSIKKELELTSEQKAAVSKIRKDGRAALKKAAASIPLGQSISEGSRLISEELKEITTAQDKLLTEILLPHQHKRLKQISFQAFEKEYGLAALLQSSEIREEFDIGNQQSSDLKKKAIEIDKKLKDDIEKLKAKARKELLDQLKPTQRAKYEELHGESFRSTQSDWEELKNR